MFWSLWFPQNHKNISRKFDSNVEAWYLASSLKQSKFVWNWTQTTSISHRFEIFRWLDDSEGWTLGSNHRENPWFQQSCPVSYRWIPPNFQYRLSDCCRPSWAFIWSPGHTRTHLEVLRTLPRVSEALHHSKFDTKPIRNHVFGDNFWDFRVPSLLVAPDPTWSVPISSRFFPVLGYI